MFLSLCYVVLRRILQLAVLRFRSNECKDLQIVVPRHQLAILRRRTRRPPMAWTDRLFLAAASRVLSRAHWRSFIITPATLLRWHQRLSVAGSAPGSHYFAAASLSLARAPARMPLMP